MEVKTVGELLVLRNSLKASQNKKTTFTFECQRCHKKVERRIFAKSIDLLCKGCLAKKTNLEKFGFENPSQAKEIKEKKKQTSLKHFGTENPMQSKEIVETLKKSNLEKFGVDNAAKLDSVKEKMKATNKEKYGEEFFAKTEKYKSTCKKSWEKKSKEELKEIEEKRKATCKEIYGDENFNNRDKFKKTCFFKYDQENPIRVEEIRKEIEKNNLEKFGVKYRMELPEFQNFLREKFLEKGKGCLSKGEIELQNFLKELEIDFLVNDREILGGKELDIYIPSKKIALEFNGLYWHSDADKTGKNIFPSKEERSIAKNRHLEKTKLCEKLGIRLIHIFEDDWNFRKDILKSILKNALGKPSKKLFARKCDLKEIDLNTYRDFLQENHLQGFSYADLRLGLFLENELVQCIGVNTKGTHSKEAELVRMCVKKGYSVQGGFSKLLKHTNLKKMISYVDRGIFSGTGYKAIGFKVVKYNDPVYFYTKGHKRIPRYTFMRKNIERNYKAGKLAFFDPKLLEADNMYANGYSRIWNCGTIKVEWTSII